MKANKNRIVIAGGGVAGISAAIKLSELGICSTVIDENPKIGGAIYRGAFRENESLEFLDPSLSRNIEDLHKDFKQHEKNITLLLQHKIIGANTNELFIFNGEKTNSISYDYLIIATGTTERSIPFSGWELPGVMFLGGMQLQIKSNLVKPGNKIVIAGTGPLLPLMAVQAHKANIEVVGVFEASRFMDISKQMRHWLNQPKYFLKGLSLLGYLKLHKIPFHYGHGIVKASGNGFLQKVELAPYDNNWYPEISSSTIYETDALGVGYGFVSRSQLSQLLNLEHRYDDFSSYVPIIKDQYQRTSKNNIFSSGDITSFMGADTAMIEGQLAAIGIALETGKITENEAHAQAKTLNMKKSKFRKFRDGFDKVSNRKLGILSIADKETIVCRCEKVTKGQVDEALSNGVSDIATLKMKTRVCMGDCQGKICSNYLYDCIANKAQNADDINKLKIRFPLEPIPFSSFQ